MKIIIYLCFALSLTMCKAQEEFSFKLNTSEIYEVIDVDSVKYIRFSKEDSTLYSFSTLVIINSENDSVIKRINMNGYSEKYNFSTIINSKLCNEYLLNIHYTFLKDSGVGFDEYQTEGLMFRTRLSFNNSTNEIKYLFDIVNHAYLIKLIDKNSVPELFLKNNKGLLYIDNVNFN